MKNLLRSACLATAAAFGQYKLDSAAPQSADAQLKDVAIELAPHSVQLLTAVVLAAMSSPTVHPPAERGALVGARRGGARGGSPVRDFKDRLRRLSRPFQGSRMGGNDLDPISHETGCPEHGCSLRARLDVNLSNVLCIPLESLVKDLQELDVG